MAEHPAQGPVPGAAGYAEAAPRLLDRRLAFDEVHAPYLHLLPAPPSCILDIGSGPGHDAATLAAMGHRVVAVEPEPDLLGGAIALHGESHITWIADALPRLDAVAALGRRYDFILMSGVWMHLDETERREAMPRVAALLTPGGVLALSLRHGPVPAGRLMFEVGGGETIALARTCGLVPVVEARRDSIQPGNRAAGVTWTILAFRTASGERS